ncbi:uncharacterized protein K460DRAFT_152293 [Cucurbitaria berberidis CBS 394.84]|uniref:Uncharacterized protein n=1 Tax=Cucurbitaria berberidis CBS 394.84 TaxID=1168544 RepID=A0A9P4GE74_9PLEO|nr:uncharacterized protein K460DRAFT_152293 [Cucurbitaria berberidis CBS 394.84]KAF1843839.1 hypothetical protein K460DRAFT_152293 [Cucurbitaria berberidis CBS 394.84]
MIPCPFRVRPHARTTNQSREKQQGKGASAEHFLFIHAQSIASGSSRSHCPRNHRYESRHLRAACCRSIVPKSI